MVACSTIARTAVSLNRNNTRICAIQAIINISLNAFRTVRIAGNASIS